jgi:hypothetical protein
MPPPSEFHHQDILVEVLPLKPYNSCITSSESRRKMDTFTIEVTIETVNNLEHVNSNLNQQ